MALKEYEAMQERCSNCSYCKWIPFDKVKDSRFAANCPASAYYKYNTYSARGRFQVGLALGKGELEYTQSVADLTRSCMACGACDVSCKICRYNLEPLEHTVAMKQSVAARGFLSEEQLRCLTSLKTEQTMLPGRKKADRCAWQEGLDLIDWTKGSADILFFPGCRYSYDPELRETLRKAIRLLKSSGVKVGTLGEADVCCAGRAWQQGMIPEFRQRTGDTTRLLEQLNVPLIVTPCADCYHAFKRLYAKEGLSVPVMHITEYLAELIDEGRLTFRTEIHRLVTYHDPCHLGRQGEAYIPWEGREEKIRNQIHTWSPVRPRYNGSHGVYDVPRRILAAIPGIELTEMHRIREYSWCCGAGSGCDLNDPQLAGWTAEERIAEAIDTGADLLVTACPWCYRQFTSGKNRDKALIDVEDIVALAEAAL